MKWGSWSKEHGLSLELICIYRVSAGRLSQGLYSVFSVFEGLVRDSCSFSESAPLLIQRLLLFKDFQIKCENILLK